MKEKANPYGEAETKRRADDLLKHMTGRPPEPHATHRPGKGRSRKKAASGRAARKAREKS